MPGKRYSRDEIATILKDWSNGLTAEQAAKKHKVTVQSLYRWKRQASGTGAFKLVAPDLSTKSHTLTELRAENARLKSVIADLLMERYNVA